MSWSKPCFPVGANSNANFWGYSKMLCESCNFWLAWFQMIGTRHNWNIRGLEIDILCPNHIFSNSRVFYQPRSDMVLGWLMFSIANLGPFTPGFPNHPNHPTKSNYPIHPYQPDTPSPSTKPHPLRPPNTTQPPFLPRLVFIKKSFTC